METMIYYNPLDERCKSVVGAVASSQNVTFRLFASAQIKAKAQVAHFILQEDGENAQHLQMERTDFGWDICLKINKAGLFFYQFCIENVGNVCADERNFGLLRPNAGESFLLTVYKKGYQTPEWFKGGVMYQIFPDRFAKEGNMPDIKGRIPREDWGGEPSFLPNEQGKVLNNDFFGGNFQGVRSKLPYLKSLGVTTIYFNPIFEAASNHRYDTADYLKIDPYLGEKEDFEQLVEDAKNIGIRVILDGVFNHTGDDSVYFNKYGNYPSLGAYQSKKSPYYSWYSFENFPDQYSSWWGIDILPQVNEGSRSYQNFIFGDDGVLKTWINSGISGYRLDVADELPDSFLKKLRKSVKSANRDAIIIGEVWEDASDKIAYSVRRQYLQGTELDSVMNYPWKDAIISYILTENGQNLINRIRKIIDHYPKQTLDCLMNILGTHDTPRILTVLGGIPCHDKREMTKPSAYLSPENKQKAIEKVKMAALLQFTLPGVPCIYYGDENAMEGYIDPFCRRCFNWDGLNNDLIAYYAKLGKIREEYKMIFADGEWKEIFCKNGFILYKRIKENQELYIFANNNNQSYFFEKEGMFVELLENKSFENYLHVQPYSYGIIKKL